MPRSGLVVVSLVVALCLPVGCASDSDDDAESTSGGEPAQQATPTGPQYPGPPIPGLAGEPAWGVEAGHSAHAYGDVVAVWRRERGAGEPFVADVYATDSGEQRATVEVDSGTGWPEAGDSEAWTGTWNGAPVLYYAYTVETESDGLSAETSTRVAEAYDTHGELVGSYEQDAEDGAFTVIDGWVVRGNGNDAAILTSEGEVIVDSVCGEMAGQCGLDPETNTIDFGGVQMLAVADGMVFQAEPRASNGNMLVARDLTSGEPLWTSDEIEVPDGVPPGDEVDGINALPIETIDDQLIVHWRHSGGFFDTSEPDTTVSVHDPKTGELLVTGPTLPVFTGSPTADGPSYHTAVDGTIAFLAEGSSTVHTTAIDLTDGEIVWEQDEDEENLSPQAIVGGVLYGYRDPDSDDGDPIAIDAESKDVVDADLTDVPTPEQLPDGNGLVTTDDALFVFDADR